MDDFGDLIGIVRNMALQKLTGKKVNPDATVIQSLPHIYQIIIPELIFAIENPHEPCASNIEALLGLSGVRESLLK